jgi:hypothetical protein
MYTLLGEYGCPSQCFPLNYDEHSPVGSLFHDHHVIKWRNHREQIDNEKKEIMNSFGGSRFSRFSLTGSVLSDLMSSGSYASTTEHDGDFLIGGGPINNGNSSGPSNGELGDSLIWGNEKKNHSSSKHSFRLSDMTMGSVSGTINASLEKLREDFRGIDDNEDDHSLEIILQRSLDTFPMAVYDHDVNEGSIATFQSLESMSVDEIDVDETVDSNGKRLDSNGKTLIHDCDTIQHILLGRGKPLQKHPGNLWLRNLISIKFDEYDTLERRMQTRLSVEIYEIILSKGRMFLKKSKNHEGFWVEIDRDAAREKLAVSFRTERKRREKMGARPDPL